MSISLAEAGHIVNSYHCVVVAQRNLLHKIASGCTNTAAPAPSNTSGRIDPFGPIARRYCARSERARVGRAYLGRVSTGYKNCLWVATATAWARVSTSSLLKIDWM